MLNKNKCFARMLAKLECSRFVLGALLGGPLLFRTSHTESESFNAALFDCLVLDGFDSKWRMQIIGAFLFDSVRGFLRKRLRDFRI